MRKSPQTLTLPPPRRPSTGGLCAVVRAAGLVGLDAPAVAAFRRKPGPMPEGWKPIAPTFLKTSDEQTVAAVAAVLAAIEGQGGGIGPMAYADWGVVAASRHLGRSQLVVALRRFGDEGVWGVSPHLIPHFALHSPAGTLSLALGAHGPNLGVGGGQAAATEGALTALTWLSEGQMPGVWLVVTGHDPEFVPGPDGQPTAPTTCVALALALEPDRGGSSRGPRLRIGAADGSETAGPVDLGDLGAWLSAAAQDDPMIGRPQTFAVDEGDGLRMEWAVGHDVATTGGW